MIHLPQIISQRDPRWASLKLGNTNLTVGDWGCTFTSGIMLAQAFGRNLDLLAVLKWMNENGGFDDKGAVMWLTFAKALGLDWGYRWETVADPTLRFERISEIDGFFHIDRLAAWGIPNIAFVDTDHDGKANHWVVYLGDNLVADPWDAQVKSFDVFGHLYGYAIMLGTPILGGGKVASIIGKANDIACGRNVELNAKEIIQLVTRP